MAIQSGWNFKARLTSAHYRYGYLLASLVLVLFVRPFFSERIFGVVLIDVLLIATLITGAVATMAGRRLILAIGLLAILSGLTRVMWRLNGWHSFLYSFLGISIIFYSTLVVLLTTSMFRIKSRITLDTIYCAVSVYLLLGLLWTLGYLVLELAMPGSFVIGGNSVGLEQQFDRLIGFSFTTLTTLGYGNIAPTTPQADAIATLEAIVGQIYLTIVIARLIGLQIAQDSESIR